MQRGERLGVSFGRCAAAGGTIAADFEPGDNDVEAAIALDLSLEAVEQIAFEFGDLSATETGHVDVISLRATLIKMFFALQVHEIEFIDQPLALEEVEGAVDGDAVDLRIEFLGAAKNSGGIEVLLGGFDDTQDHFALAGHAKSAGHELGLETSGLLGLGKRHKAISLELQLDCNYAVYAENGSRVTGMAWCILKKAFTTGGT
jgi:hypothetical protein